jgi:hypothetical protein
LIQGAGRVGKTTISGEFAAKDYKTAIIIDFARSSKRKTPDALRGAGYEVEEYR